MVLDGFRWFHVLVTTPRARILIMRRSQKYRAKLCGGKTHRNREVPGGSKIDIRSMLPYFYVSIIY